MIEYPPILSGSERRQIAALRDYLVRVARSLDTAEQAAQPAAASARTSPQSGAVSAQAEETRRETGQLRSLIVKTAQALDSRLGEQIDTVRRSVDSVGATLREDYLAVSDFGSYSAQARLEMSAAARAVVEDYALLEKLETVEGRCGELDSALSSLHGQIRRGLITDPETGEQQMGIAIAEDLHFTGQVRTENGREYRELSPGQTLGLYTASGWQFWINGSKRGWFDSQDGQLHLSQLSAAGGIRLGADWLLTAAGGLGIKYTGG